MKIYHSGYFALFKNAFPNLADLKVGTQINMVGGFEYSFDTYSAFRKALEESRLSEFLDNHQYNGQGDNVLIFSDKHIDSDKVTLYSVMDCFDYTVKEVLIDKIEGIEARSLKDGDLVVRI